MLNLVRADLYRIFHGKLIKVSCFLTIGWVLLCSYAQKATLDIREYLTGSEVTADYWNAFFNYYPVVIPLVIFCSYFVSNDFRQGTVKLYIEKGISRWKYCFSKLVVSWLATAMFLIIAFGTGILCNKVFLDFAATPYMTYSSILSYVLCQILFHMSVATLVTAVVLVIKNSAFSMAINFIFVLFGYLVLHGLEQIFNLDYAITMFWAFSNINKTRFDTSQQWLPVAVIVFIGYNLIWGGISGLIFKKRDIS